MRSEERAGIVFAILLLVWGTPVAEPFRIFVRYIARVMEYLPWPGIAVSLVTAAVLSLVCIILTALSKTSAVYYMPCAIAGLCLAGFTIRGFSKGEVYVPEAIALIAPVAILLVLYILKADKALIWASDIYIYSIPVGLITYLVTMPLASLSETLSRILFINRNNDIDLTKPFTGIANIPGVVWGVVIAVVLLLPVLFASLGKRLGGKYEN